MDSVVDCELTLARILFKLRMNHAVARLAVAWHKRDCGCVANLRTGCWSKWARVYRETFYDDVPPVRVTDLLAHTSRLEGEKKTRALT